MSVGEQGSQWKISATLAYDYPERKHLEAYEHL